MIYIDELII